MTVALPERGFCFLPGYFQYSFGVVALPGYRMERARFRRPVALAAGFAFIRDHLASIGRPPAAFAACELRSPKPFTPDGFDAFNRVYASVLEEWGVFAEGRNPVARSNVCPEIEPPAEPSFHAFTYSVPDGSTGPSFVVAGGTETREGEPYPDNIVALNDHSPAGLAAKNDQVMTEMERRMRGLGVTYAQATAVNLYTVYDPHPVVGRGILARGAPALGIEWHLCRPPVVGMDWEVDCRGIPLERVL